MKKNFKRWLAFLLAVVLVATSGMFRSESFLQATDESGAESLVVGEGTQMSLNNITEDEITLPPAEPETIPENQPTTENPAGQPTDVPPTTENPGGQPADTQQAETPEEPETTTETPEEPVVEPEGPIVTPDTAVQQPAANNAAGPMTVEEPTEEPEEDPSEDDLKAQDPEEQADEVPIPENVTVTVLYQDETGATVNSIPQAIGFGNILEKLEEVFTPDTSYTYISTTYENTAIESLSYVDGNYIAKVSGSNFGNIVIDDTQKIVILYSKQLPVTINYDVKVNGEADTQGIVTLRPTTNTMAGVGFNFSVETASGYIVESVTATCNGEAIANPQTTDGIVYSVDGASVKGGTIDISVNVIEKTKYNITFEKNIQQGARSNMTA